MHILYIYQYFTTPEEGGRTRSYEFARRLVKKGKQKEAGVPCITEKKTGSISAFKYWYFFTLRFIAFLAPRDDIIDYSVENKKITFKKPNGIKAELLLKDINRESIFHKYPEF